MYAIILVGGNQYRVSQDTNIEVDRLPGKTGDMVKFPALLVADGKKVMLGKESANITVHATITSQILGDKVSTLRFRAKSRHRRRVGYRPHLTILKISSIGEPAKTESTSPQKNNRPNNAKKTKTTSK